ncbi:hypothetical protein GEMRC1_014157 [Eukaryota sp. GEM-RC1]
MTTPHPEPLMKRSRSSPPIISPCQTLLVLIHLHLLKRLFERTLENYDDRTNPQLTALKTSLPAFFGQVGYVSNHFLDSSFQAVKVFFQLHTFHADLKHLPKLISLASFFGADLQSVFLDVYSTLNIDKFLNYSGIITGLRIVLRKPSDLEFLNKSSSLFPRLKQLDVELRESVFLLLTEALKTNTTVTGVDLTEISIGAEGARTLAEALKVNTSVTSINLSVNSIRDEGARALAEVLKVNTSVTIVNLGGNSIGDEGARALADALTVNASITSIDLRFNSIGDEGARALAEALKVNTKVDILYSA